MTARLLASEAWPTVPTEALVLVPIGSIEQHGPHLPLDTDAVIATAVVDRVAALLARRGREAVLAAPVVSYGASGEHQGFAGTSSIGTDALQLLVVELVRSLRTWASRVVLVNAHGGNVTALSHAVAQLQAEGHDVDWTACRVADADAHAGYTETSLMLHLDPTRVRTERATVGDTRALATILPAMREGGVVSVSPNGVLGDPTGASADDGARIFEAMAHRVAADVLRSDRVH